MKFVIRNLDLEEFELINFGVGIINTSFAVLEKFLMDAQSKEELKKIMLHAGQSKGSNPNLIKKIENASINK